MAVSRGNDATLHDSWVSLSNLIFKRFFIGPKTCHQDTKAPRKTRPEGNSKPLGFA
jgi:hypothetical protein